MTDFILELTFDELPTDKKHQDMIRKEIETRIDSREWFTKNISYNTAKIVFKPKLLIMKFFKDSWWDDGKYSLNKAIREITEDAIEIDLSLSSKGHLEHRGLILNAGDRIYVQASEDDVVAQLYGYEE